MVNNNNNDKTSCILITWFIYVVKLHFKTVDMGLKPPHDNMTDSEI